MGKKVYELTLEIGHKASLLQKKLPNKPDYTHKWELTVRGAKPSIKLECIQKVVFQLHESFENPNREITEAPFTLREIGYAGFEIPITVHFKHKEKPVAAQFIHDLCLLIDKSNESFHYHKVKFASPLTREFEKSLIKSGAQLLTVSSKKERSDSPPAKKQKSSSLIPSKDMNKQQHSPLLPSQTPQPHIPSSNNHKSSKHNSSHHSSSHHSSFKQSHSHQHQNHQQPPQPQSSSQKSKPSSREFIDIFGNPLAYNNGSGNISTNDISISRETSATSNTISSSKSSHKEHSSKKSHSHKEHKEHREHKEHKGHKEQTKSSYNINNNTSTNNHFNSTVATSTSSNHTSSNPNNHSNHHQSSYHDNSNHSHSSKRNHNKNHIVKEEISKEDQYANDLHYIQTKISCLSDCDRLQKIVDIVEEAGEWYNLTPKKFEFDLKRLDKKTLSRIEKCLNY